MISVDRYYAITKPLEYGVKRTPRRMLICVSLVWLGAACISLPPVLILGNEHSTVDGVPHCTVCQNFGYQIYATLGSFYIPLTVMITVYYKIFRAARKIVLEERRAQSHLENSHCYLEISVKNGVGPVESKIAATAPERGQHGHRASSSASTVTTVSVCILSHHCYYCCCCCYIILHHDLMTRVFCARKHHSPWPGILQKHRFHFSINNDFTYLLKFIIAPLLTYRL